MKRDMELIRDILFCLEDDKDLISISGIEESKIHYHLDLLRDANLVLDDSFYDTTISAVPLNRLRITWDGHEFLDSVRDPSIWKLIQENLLIPTGAWTLSLIVDYAKQKIREKIGI